MMEYTKLGKTGMDVSRVCLGAMSFGDPNKWIHNWVLPKQQAETIVKEAVNIGINFFDTANVYGLGSSEEILGDLLTKYTKRHEIVLATKLSEPMRTTPNGRGLSRKEIFYEVECSLKRLKTDYLDLLYIHRFDPQTDLAETLSALNDLVRSGKVLALGASSMAAWQFQKAQYLALTNGWTPFSVMQNHYNLLYREEEREMIPLCQDLGVALVPYSPLAAGRLARGLQNQSLRAKNDRIAQQKYDKTIQQDSSIIKRVAQLAQKYNVSMTQIALAWLYAKGVCAPILGVTKVQYLNDYALSFDVCLTKDDIHYLEELYEPHKIVGYKM